MTPLLSALAFALPAPLKQLDVTPESLVLAGIGVIGTLLVARYAARATQRLVSRVEGVHDDLTLQASRIVRYAVLLVGAGVVLAVLGADIQPVLVATILLCVGVFLMARGIADNLGASFVIQARRALRLGDFVELAGIRGHVSDLNTRSVVVETAEGRTVHVPNRTVLDEPFANLTSHGRLRSEVEVRVRKDRTEGPAVDAKELGTLLADVRGVLPAPAPHALLVVSEPERRVFRLRFWHEPEIEAQVASRVITAVDEMLAGTDREGAACWPPPPPPLTVSGPF